MSFYVARRLGVTRPPGLEPGTPGLEGRCSDPTELRALASSLLPRLRPPRSRCNCPSGASVTQTSAQAVPASPRGVQSSRRGLNPRPHPYQGCALPLSYASPVICTSKPPHHTPACHQSKQGRRDLNPQPPVLETGALPVELRPFILQKARPSSRWLGLAPRSVPGLPMGIPGQRGNGWGRSRTVDTGVFSAVLYRLSYPAHDRNAKKEPISAASRAGDNKPHAATAKAATGERSVTVPNYLCVCRVASKAMPGGRAIRSSQ